jgi:hypothetical protein
MDTGVSETTVNLFTTNATSVVIGKSGGSTVTTNGNIKVGSNIIQAADGATALTLTSTSGNVAVAGELTVTGNNIKSSTGATAITLSGGNVIIPGDLTVNGTTLTVDATTVSIEDPVIGFGFTSGSATRGAPGDRGFIGGLDGENNVAMIWDESADGFGVFRTTSSTTSSLPVDVVDYSTFRAGKLELGGATAFITSSGGSALTLQGATVTSTATGGANSIVASTGVLINSQNGNTILQNGGTDIMRVSGSAGNNALDVKVGGAGVTTVNLFSTVATSVNFAGAASTALIMGNSAGSNQISGQTRFNQGLSGSLTKLSDGTSYLIAGTNVTITTGSSGAVTIASTATTTNAAGGDTQVQFNDGGTSFGADADFTFTKGTNTLAVPNASVTAVTASSVIAGGATVDLFDTTATTVNFARAATTLTAGASGGSTTFQGNLTGSNVLVSSGLTVGLGAAIGGGATFGGGFGSAGVSIAGPTGNIETNGTLLVEGTTTLSGSVFLGDASGDNLTFNGRAASDLVPNATNQFDLGTPDLRWRNMYTGDLHLKNERGDWTVIEEEEFLTLTNNKSGKRYKFVLEEI